MKNALIINGGENTTNRDQIGEFDFIVAVDSGAEHAYKLFLKPNLIIGDLDSISTKTYDRVNKDRIEILEYKKNKDYTDFEIALSHIIDLKIKDVTVIGGEDGDIDHLLKKYKRSKRLNYSDNESIRGYLIKMFELYKNKKLKNIKLDYSELRYNRLAKKLDRIFNS